MQCIDLTNSSLPFLPYCKHDIISLFIYIITNVFCVVFWGEDKEVSNDGIWLLIHMFCLSVAGVSLREFVSRSPKCLGLTEGNRHHVSTAMSPGMSTDYDSRYFTVVTNRALDIFGYWKGHYNRYIVCLFLELFRCIFSSYILIGSSKFDVYLGDSY